MSRRGCEPDVWLALDAGPLHPLAQLRRGRERLRLVLGGKLVPDRDVVWIVEGLIDRVIRQHPARGSDPGTTR